MAAILLDSGVMNSQSLLLFAALLFASLPTVRAADPISFREIAMLLRNGEDPQFIINDTTRRKSASAPLPGRGANVA